jgi:hypothetical protein
MSWWKRKAEPEKQPKPLTDFMDEDGVIRLGGRGGDGPGQPGEPGVHGRLTVDADGKPALWIEEES